MHVEIILLHLFILFMLVPFVNISLGVFATKQCTIIKITNEFSNCNLELYCGYYKTSYRRLLLKSYLNLKNFARELFFIITSETKKYFF